MILSLPEAALVKPLTHSGIKKYVKSLTNFRSESIDQFEVLAHTPAWNSKGMPKQFDVRIGQCLQMIKHSWQSIMSGLHFVNSRKQTEQKQGSNRGSPY